MAPLNDNLASAVVLGATGQLFNQSNIGATAEAGEPVSNGKTVWFSWRATGISFAFFSTLNGNPDFPQLATIVRVFTGPDVQHLTELPYIFDQRQHYGGVSKCSYVAVDLTAYAAGTLCYVRVDGVGGAEGFFSLEWGEFFHLTLGDCQNCPPDLDPGSSCALASVASDVMASTGTEWSFGDHEAGSYSVRYCKGAFNYFGGWTVTMEAHNIPMFDVRYSGGFASFDPIPTPRIYTTQQRAEIAYRCTSADFEHTGGPIKLRFTDSPTWDNSSGNPDPVFALYRRVMVFSVTPCARWVSTGLGRVDLFVTNLTDKAWSGVVPTLTHPGGTLTGPSVNFAANGQVTIGFDLPTTTPNVDVTLTLSHPFSPDAAFQVFLGPILTLGAIQGPYLGACNGRKWAYSFEVTNLGYWAVQVTATFANTAGLTYCQNPIVAFIECSRNSGRTVGINMDVKAAAIPKTGLFSVAFKDSASGASVGSLSLGQLTVPA